MKNIFDGIRVVEFTSNIAGPFPGAFLADFGAEIIKIERPKLGDDSRAFSPVIDGVGIPFMWNNRGKKSLVLDMTVPKGIEIAKKLVATADVVLDSFKPGTMKKFGIDYETVKKINPKVIYCSVSAFGQTGPRAAKPGYDTIAQALSGFMDLSGDPDGPPVRTGPAIADYLAGTFAYGGIASALYYRERTGEGQYVDVCLLDCLTSINGLFEPAALGLNPTRTGNHHRIMAPFGSYEGNNGESVIICAPAQAPWATLCKLMGREDMITDPLYTNSGIRAKNTPILVEQIEKWLKTFDNLDDAIKLMDDANVPCAKVCTTAETTRNEQLITREMVVELETPDGVTSVQKFKARGNPFKFSSHKADMKKAPALGQHQDEVLKFLGYSDAEIAQIKTDWNIS